jgi:hypothetical protein
MSKECPYKCPYFHIEIFDNIVRRECNKPVNLPCPSQFALKEEAKG